MSFYWDSGQGAEHWCVTPNYYYICSAEWSFIKILSILRVWYILNRASFTLLDSLRCCVRNICFLNINLELFVPNASPYTFYKSLLIVLSSFRKHSQTIKLYEAGTEFLVSNYVRCLVYWTRILLASKHSLRLLCSYLYCLLHLSVQFPLWYWNPSIATNTRTYRTLYPI